MMYYYCELYAKDARLVIMSRTACMTVVVVDQRTQQDRLPHVAGPANAR